MTNVEHLRRTSSDGNSPQRLDAGAATDLPSQATRDAELCRLEDEVNRLCLRLGEPARYPAVATVPPRGDDQLLLRLRESESRYRTLFDLSPVAVYAIDAEGRIQQFNRHAAELWGQSPTLGDTDQLFCGSHKLFLPDGTFMPHHECPMATVASGIVQEARDTEVVIERPDASRITVIVNIVPLKNEDGVITGAINCFYDITERSRLQRETREQAIALAKLHKRKDEFLAILSHELRNPLAPIVNAVQVLRLQETGPSPQQQSFDIIERQAKQLGLLVDDLLEISRITSGRIQLHSKEIAISEVVARAVETTRHLIDQRGHEFTVTLPEHAVWLYADATRMEQVLVNLLTNAAKYTRDSGQIWLTVQQHGDVMELEVRDSGIGISTDLLPHVFELFTQEPRGLDRSEGGLGLGLALVQRLIELHGGSVSAESVLGQGSAFTVRMPVVQLSSLLVPQSRDVINNQRQKTLRILIVDDNVDAATTLAVLLKASAHEVQTAHDGTTALASALLSRPDVMLLDIGLPELNGYEVAAAVRQQPALTDTVLVAVTGYGQESDRQHSREAGFNHHLVKPVSFAELQKLLATI